MERDRHDTGIGGHAFLSDCSTAALVTPHGDISWMCVPDFDGPALFCGLLDSERGGSWSLEVEGARPVRYGYAGDTLVLETLWEGQGTSVLCRDLLAVRPSGDGIRAQGVLLRALECRRGTAEVRSRVRARPDFGRSSLTWKSEGDGALHDGQGLLLSGDTLPAVTEDGDAEYHVRLAEGDTAVFALDYRNGERRVGADEGRELVAETLETWSDWAGRTDYEGFGAPHVRRSALTLRGLLHEETGGMVAAATTSLPEWPGGPRNWDYRYVWHRDAPLVVLSFLRLGHAHEARAYLRYLLRTCDGPLTRLAPVHTLSGGLPPEEETLDHLEGFAGSRPVRVGNDAAGQHQLDVYGHVLDAALTYQQAEGDLTDSDFRQLYLVVEAARRLWREPDEGLWEVRGQARHWTNSKVYAWACLDRAIQLVGLAGQAGEVPLDDWRADRDALRADVLRNGFDSASGSFTQTYGTTRVDGSLLRIPLLGFLKGKDPRVVRTIERIQDELGEAGHLVYRYEPESTDDGLGTPEGAFLLCSFEMVSALVLAGRVREAERRFHDLCGYAGELGLLSEEVSGDGVMLGNFPQAFTHLALIDAAVNLDDAGDTEALHAWARNRSGGGA